MSVARLVYVYVIGREEGPVKIGISADPMARLRELQVGCPFRISLLHRRPRPSRAEAKKHEDMVHAVHEGKNLVGEWFDMDLDLAIEAIDTSILIDDHFKELDRLEGRR